MYKYNGDDIVNYLTQSQTYKKTCKQIVYIVLLLHVRIVIGYTLLWDAVHRNLIVQRTFKYSLHKRQSQVSLGVVWFKHQLNLVVRRGPTHLWYVYVRQM